jgi:hypothetical protein
MKRLFGKLPATTAAILVAASFAMVSYVDAAGDRGGGGGGRGGGGGGGAGARAGGGAQAGGGGARQNAQVNNTKADARSNNVRSTSVNNVNNVNVDRNVNVNVSGNNCCNNGWDNDYHPVATAAAITATAAVIGSIVRAPPPGCVPVNYGGVVYQQCGSTWYAPQGSQFAVVAPPY